MPLGKVEPFMHLWLYSIILVYIAPALSRVEPGQFSVYGLFSELQIHNSGKTGSKSTVFSTVDVQCCHLGSLPQVMLVCSNIPGNPN